MKKNKNLILFLVILVTVLSGIVFVNVFIGAVVQAKDTDDSVSVSPATIPQVAAEASSLTVSGVAAARPSQLMIPSIGVNAHVQETGITKRGTVGTPTNYTDVAWYMYGPVPGSAQGSAVIDGHVDNGLGLDGVFKHLDSIKQGDDVYVVTNGGATLDFVVTNIASYDYKNAPVATLFATSGSPVLTLITCEGNWVKSDTTYDERLVVTAVLRK